MARFGRAYPIKRVYAARFAPVAYDATGVGWPPTTLASSFTYAHTATAGAYVVVDIAVDRTATVSTITYNGVAMTSLGSAACAGFSGNATIFRYGLANVPGGAKTVAGTLSTGSLWGTSCSVSYMNVVSVGSAQTTSGSSAPSQAVTCLPGQVIVESIMIPQSTLGTPSGGTNRYNASNANLSLAVSDATASTTFSTSSSGHTWAAIATVLKSH